VELEEGDASDETASGGDASSASWSSWYVSVVLSEGAWAFLASSASCETSVSHSPLPNATVVCRSLLFPDHPLGPRLDRRSPSQPNH
jgi:hypothetical protein